MQYWKGSTGVEMPVPEHSQGAEELMAAFRDAIEKPALSFPPDVERAKMTNSMTICLCLDMSQQSMARSDGLVNGLRTY